ncbi:hypothetical protein JR316_0007678 [Psilocybe cubensis]|uniref:Uncharacterized protein n=1 Tax=Psilocybe cubensis TaxID=181762 RepID=A0ACB8GUF3_PSICU|nr:hypothetical protein JR316_0007678 [Psilocybe cubensis]KAH9479099.1 hypothetical protein JR316_0007678 [Psilocybe cubensis]
MSQTVGTGLDAANFTHSRHKVTKPFSHAPHCSPITLSKRGARPRALPIDIALSIAVAPNILITLTVALRRIAPLGSLNERDSSGASGPTVSFVAAPARRAAKQAAGGTASCPRPGVAVLIVGRVKLATSDKALRKSLGAALCCLCVATELGGV